MGVVDDEVGGEHGGGDFVAVATVADEAIDQTWLIRGLWGDFSWVVAQASFCLLSWDVDRVRWSAYECQLHRAAEACRCCFVVVGVAVFGLAC